MVFELRRLAILTAVLMLAAILPFGQALHAEGHEETDAGRCGVTLVLRNPDLQESADGFIRASGLFFIQFQAVGVGAENVDYFTFSFGKPAPGDLSSCTGPAWVSGAYVQNYRGDYDARDGFFVPINTTLVPDDAYGAAVHAYDASDQEIGRFWVSAIVQNNDGDKIMPWPMILPGDGEQTNTDVNGLTIEFAEPLESVEAWINGEPIDLEDWEGREFDDDATPGNDGQGGPTDSVCLVSGPQCVKRHWGPSYKWEGPIGDQDILKVRAVDKAGNVAVKIVHLLDPNAGGVITGTSANVNLQVDEETKETHPGAAATFEFTLTNIASQESHVSLLYDAPANVDVVWDPDHVVVEAGGQANARMYVTPDADTGDATYTINARASYQDGSSVAEAMLPVTVISGVGHVFHDEEDNGTVLADNETGAPDEGGDSPGLGVAVLLATLIGLAVVRRTRQ